MKEKTIQVLPWKAIKDRVKAVNLDLYNMINSVPNVDSFKILRVKYPYGFEIIKNGSFHLNINGASVPFSSNDIPKNIENLLDYAWKSIPFGMVLKNSVESYIDHDNYIVPLGLLTEGMPFSLFTIFENKEDSYFYTPLYSLTAGCRSLISLPRLSHKSSLERLAKSLGLKNLSPANKLSEQWEIIKKIPENNSKWNTELIYFPEDFIKDTQETLPLRFYLLDSAWKKTSFNRNDKMFNFIWSQYIESLPISQRHNTFIIETVKHLLTIIFNNAPGYAIATDNIACPLTEITNRLLTDYKIRFNYPAFMKIAFLNEANTIYYSLQKHTFLHEIPTKRHTKKAIEELKSIENVYMNFLLFLNKHKKFNNEEFLILKKLNQVSISFYHPKDRTLTKNIYENLNKDQSFIKIQNSIKKTNYRFPLHSIFFNGCIIIHKLSC